MTPENSPTSSQVTPITVTPTPSAPLAESKAVSPAIKSPPPEVLKQTFDTPSDLGLDSDTTVVQEQQKKEVKQPDSSTAAIAAKTTEAVAKVAEKSMEVIKPIKPSEAASRDYTGFSQDEVKVLKNMSKQSFDYTVKLIKEKKELEAAKDYQYLQNPEAYVLHPQYKKAQEDSYYANAEAQYWQQQLLNIREGKKWTPIQGWDKQGKPVLGAEQEPTAIAEEQVRSVMNSAAQAGQQSNLQIQQLQQQYTQHIQNSDSQIKAEQQKRFGWHQDPKMLENMINVEGIGERSIRQIKQDFSDLFPAHYRNSIVTDIAGDLFVGLQIFAAEVRALKSQTQVAEIKKEEILRGEPSSSIKPSASNGKTRYGVDKFDLEGLPTF